MPTRVHLPIVLANLAAGTRTLEADGGTLGEVLQDVAARFPALGQRLRDQSGSLYPFVTIYLNDEDVRFHGGLAAAIRDGDQLTVVPAIAGG